MPRRIGFIIAGLLMFITPLYADGPADNNPDTVRPVPKVGIEVPEADRKELEAGLAKLGAKLEKLRPEGEPDFSYRKTLQPWDFYADVAIFHRAVRVALEDQEFFDPKDIAAAKDLLKAGQERAEQLARGETPWVNQTGLVVRGYISVIDHTPQPFGLVIPENFENQDPRLKRIDVWCHGRGETLSEVNFLTQRMSSVGPISSPTAIVLHPYGRYCNANKFAGEIDAFEALQSLRRGINKLPLRVAMRGFSMGGAACWQFAVHYPGRWFAATPGAGFSETPEFLKFFQKETLNPPWWEEKLWRWYDCPGYVGNLRNTPVIAYSGEDDIQKQAADVMEAAYEQEGMKLPHIVAPKTGHSITPAAAKEIEEFLTAAAANDPVPNKLEFVTYTLIYPAHQWVQIHRMKEQWEPSRVTADLSDDGEIQVRTSNVEKLRLRFPLAWVKKATSAPFSIDGVEIKNVFAAGPPRQIAFEFELGDGKWKFGGERALGLEKMEKRRLCGPIDHAFMDSFIFVKPTGQCAHPEVQKWVDAEMNRAITQWRRQFRGDARVKLDTELTDDDVKYANLVLWGDRKSNAWIEKIADKLPIQWDDSAISVGEQKFDAPNHALIAIYPNPQNYQRYIVLNSGFTFREYDYLNNARQTPKLPDWAVVDLRTPPNSRWPGKIVAADFFDEDWRLKPTK